MWRQSLEVKQLSATAFVKWTSNISSTSTAKTIPKSALPDFYNIVQWKIKKKKGLFFNHSHFQWWLKKIIMKTYHHVQVS